MENRHISTLLAVVQFAKTIFFEDDDDETEETLEKIENFAEETVPNFNDMQFKRNFRMLPQTFEDLLTKLHDVQIRVVKKGHPEVLLEKQLMITIWYLANIECFRSVAGRFNVSESSCWSILYRTCKQLLIVNATYKIIAWPTERRAEVIQEEFQRRNGFPGVIGAIDGCHIRIVKPTHHPNSYVNRKGYHSVLLQGVCDHKKQFIDVYAGQPGSIHDATLFRKSDLSTRIENNEIQFYNGHLVGDLAYKLSPTLMVGFKDYGTLNVRQKNFNYKLSQIRAVIENSYAYLKGRFRRLKFLETVRKDFISLVIVSSCILHNVCILNDDPIEDLMNIEDEIEQERLNNDVADVDNPRHLINNVSRMKRNNIVRSLELDHRFI